LRKTSLVVFVALVASVALAQESTPTKAFGLDIGKPLSIPECQLVKVYKKAFVYSYKDAGVCFQHQPAKFGAVWLVQEDVSTPAGTETVKIVFPIPDRPDIIVGDIMATIVDGKIEALIMKTGGPLTADIVMKALAAKYGKPKLDDGGTASNLLGARVPTVLAIWSFPELTVTFQSVTPSDITTGSLVIETPVAARLKAASFKQGTKL